MRRAGGYSGLFQLAVISVFASQALAPNGFRDALFWHEPVGDEIPGNMQIILHDQGTRAKRVFVSRRESYDRLIALGAPSDKVKQLGYIYSFVRENKHRPHILVCTNSENVGHLTELASLMPQMHFMWRPSQRCRRSLCRQGSMTMCHSTLM